MSKSNHPFFESVEKDPKISQKVAELYRVPHDNHDERIEKIKNILEALTDHPNNRSDLMKFELMLQTTREEQDDAKSNQSTP